MEFNEEINIKWIIIWNIKNPRDEGGFIARIYVGWCVCLYVHFPTPYEKMTLRGICKKVTTKSGPKC